MKTAFRIVVTLLILGGIGGWVRLARQTHTPLGVHAEHTYPKGNLPTAKLARELFPQMQATWSGGAHTAIPVPIGAIGPEKYISRLKGVIDNTLVAKVIHRALSEKTSVVLVIGDGMGPMHMALPIYANVAARNGKTTCMERILTEGSCGYCLTHAHDEIVTGSSAAGTALASSQKTREGIVGQDPDGKPLASVLDLAESLGMSTGLVTDTRLTHATPAAFFASVISRNDENAIAADLCDSNDIEVLLGGGARHFVPQGSRVEKHPLVGNPSAVLSSASRRKDGRDLLSQMRDKGYKVATDEESLLKVDGSTQKLLGLFAASGMNATIDRDQEKTGEPSLPQMSEKALQLLRGNRKGYFLMVECGRIDWESHRNDAGAVMAEMVELDEVLGAVYEATAPQRESTLFIFTSDHETGGLGISYSRINLGPPTVLQSGQTWTPKIYGLGFDELGKYNKQEKSLYEIIKMAKDPEHLSELVSQYTPYKITQDQACRVLEE